MKTRETKARDLAALTESLQSAKSAMIVSFSGLSVTKDQEFRNSLREAGAKYQVVKNTLARIAVKGTDYEQATEHLKGVTAIAWTESDPVVLTKAVSKFMKENADIYTFKTGVVDGKLVDLKQLTEIASLPSKEELISKLLYVISAQAQRIVTVINAVPRDLAVVIKQIGDKAPEGAPEAASEEGPVSEAVAESADEAPAVEASEEAPATEAAAEPGEEAPVAEAAQGGDADGGESKPEAPVEQAEEAQESKEEEQDPGSPEAEQAEEAEKAEEEAAEEKAE